MIHHNTLLPTSSGLPIGTDGPSDLFMSGVPKRCGQTVRLALDSVRVIIAGREHVIVPEPAFLHCEADEGHEGNCWTYYAAPPLAKITWPRPEVDDAHR